MEFKLREFSRRDDKDILKKYISSLNSHEICTNLSDFCWREDAVILLQTLFNGLSNTSACQDKRMKIIEALLIEIHLKATSAKACDKLINVVSSEIDNFSSEQMIKLISSCLQMIQSQSSNSVMCWKDLLPNLLNNICGKSEVDHGGAKMTGAEYKNEIIAALCMMDWRDHVITNLAAMFIDISLTAEEHLRVVNKFCGYIPKLKPDELPPLIHQILLLTKTQHSMVLFVVLERYFQENVYSKIALNSSGSQPDDSTDVCKLQQYQEIEGTILYHIYTAASKSGPQGVKELVKILKDSSKRPEFILQPFYVMLLLTISCMTTAMEEEVCSLLSGAILQTAMEGDTITESAWLESVLPLPLDIDKHFDKIIFNCFRGRDRALKGLVTLGISLLNIKQGPRGVHKKIIWIMGSNILTKMVKQCRDVTGTVLQSLASHISQLHDSTQYTDCLARIARKSPLNLLDNSSVLLQLLDNSCFRIPGGVGQRVLCALLPLVRMSPSLRDNVIIMLRKSLFSQEVSGRTMAVFGLLELLKGLKISDFKSLSQSMSQNYCGLTQIYSETYSAPGPSHSNEGMCLEVLSILREVFKHQASVKRALYIGIYESVCSNIELSGHVLDYLQNHLEKFLQPGDTIPPVDFDKTVAVHNNEAVVLEPLPHLILGISLILAKTDELSDTKTSRLKKSLNSLCDSMADSDIPHFGLDQEDGFTLLDSDPDSQMKQERIRLILGVYESLMGYTLVTWSKDENQKGLITMKLFKGYSRLVDFTKGLNKGEKKGKGKGGGLKSTFKLPPTSLNLKCISRLLMLLNCVSVDWATEQSVIAIKGKRELHRYSMHVAVALIKEAQSIPASELERHNSTMGYLCHIGRTIYTRCLCRWGEMKEFDLPTAISSLECFSELLSLVLSHFPSKLSNFLNDVTEAKCELKLQLEKVIGTLLDNLEELLTAEEDGGVEGEEQIMKTAMVLMLSISSALVQQLRRDGPCLQNILDRLKKICKERRVENPQVARPLLSLLLNTQARCKTKRGLILDLAYSLCDVMSLIDDEMEVEEHTKYSIVNTKTANACLTAICEAVHQSVGEVDWAISRFRAELLGLVYPTADPLETRRELLKDRERELCLHLNLSVKVLSILCSLAVMPGPHADAVLKELSYLYSRLTIITKYFITKVGKFPHALQSSRFEKTVKLVDSELSKNMYCFTEHVIADGAASGVTEEKKTSKVNPTLLKNKVLKETKIIPRVIYEKEQFNKFILQLSNKAKVDLASQTKHTMARDYRLYTKQVRDILEKENIQLDDNMESGDGDTSTLGTQSEEPSSKRSRT